MATVSRLSVSLISQHCDSLSTIQFVFGAYLLVPVPDVYLLSTVLLETTSLRLCCKRSGECKFSRNKTNAIVVCSRKCHSPLDIASHAPLIPASVELMTGRLAPTYQSLYLKLIIA